MMSLASALAFAMICQPQHLQQLAVSDFPAWMRKLGVEVKLVDKSRGWWQGTAGSRTLDILATPENGATVNYADARVTFQTNKVIDRLDLAALLVKHPDTHVQLHSYLDGQVQAYLPLRIGSSNEGEARDDVKVLVDVATELERGLLKSTGQRQIHFGEAAKPLPIDGDRVVTSLEAQDMGYLTSHWKWIPSGAFALSGPSWGQPMAIDGWTVIVWAEPGPETARQFRVTVRAKMPESPEEWLRQVEKPAEVKFSKIYEGMQATFKLDLGKGMTIRDLHDWFANIPAQMRKVGLEPLAQRTG